jgi:hypothetical protein
MTFTAALEAIPFTATTPNGTGWLPPIIRASGHILHLAASLADEAIPVTDEEALNELQAALGHLNSRTGTDNISTATREAAANLDNLVAQTIAEFSGWTPEDRVKNLEQVGHRFTALASTLDWELIGLRSDPGTSL